MDYMCDWIFTFPEVFDVTAWDYYLDLQDKNKKEDSNDEKKS